MHAAQQMGAHDLHSRKDEYLEHSAISPLSEANSASLNDPVTVEKLKTTIKSLPNRHALGPDGFSYGYYKTYVDFLVP